MAKILSKEEFLENSDFYMNEIKDGKIFIYPTDTIYGIGCNAQNCESVSKIREIKKRDMKPFSVIAPSKKWILDNCKVLDSNKNYLDKIPGAFTFIFELENQNVICKNEVIGDLLNVGVRIFDNFFYKTISQIGFSFITSSVNISGEKHIEKVKDIPLEILESVDYVIDDGILNGRGSTIIDLSSKEVKVIRK